MPRGGSYGKSNSNSQFSFGRFGPSESALARFLYPFAWRDTIFFFDDFNDKIANIGDHWTLGTDAGSTAFAHNAGLGGRIQGVTEAAAADYIAILSAANWFGDNQAGTEWRWQVNNIVTTKWEVGFTDPLGDNTLPALNDIDTPSITNCATDVAVIARDSAQTLTTAAFITDGGTACYNTTATTLSGCYIGTNAVYRATKIQIVGDAAAGFVLDDRGGLLASAQHGATAASSIEGGTALTSRLTYGTLACTAMTVTIDYAAMWEDRQTSY